MKRWEAKFLGFCGAWWLVLQPLIGGPLPHLRPALGLVMLLVGAMAAMSVPTTDESSTPGIIASWFLRAIFSMIVLLALVVVMVLLAVLAHSLTG